MSYPAPNTGNTMNDLFSRLSDFHQLSWHILEAETIEAFHVWLDKLILIDRRSTILFLEQHKSEIPEDRLKLAERRCMAKPEGGPWNAKAKTEAKKTCST